MQLFLSGLVFSALFWGAFIHGLGCIDTFVLPVVIMVVLNSDVLFFCLFPIGDIWVASIL